MLNKKMKASSRYGDVRDTRVRVDWGKEVTLNTQEEIFDTILGICDKYSIQFNSLEVFRVQVLYADHNTRSYLE